LKVKRLPNPTKEQIEKAYTVKNADVTKTLTEAETKRLLDKSLQVNKRWDEWWIHTADVDVQRVADAVNQGVNNGQTVEEVTAVIRGTKDGNYEDGLLSKNRIDARRMARTITAGIANEAKDQFYRDNADVVLGVEWLDTLDGRTCFGCASLSRMQWKVDEPHPIPPLHPNCRCVLLPVTALSALVDEVRPAAKSDFMADARRAYEKKHPGKKFDELAESTRKKYYYDAIHDYEAHTGQPAFEMVGGRASFKDYFENIMTEQQRKDWLGPERYKLWKSGKYKFDDFVTPYPNRNMSVLELKKLDIASLAG
jgi:SPP1 gp7 family putative phage head morphogenesis protein